MSLLAPALALLAVVLGGEGIVRVAWPARDRRGRGLRRALALVLGLGVWGEACTACLLAGATSPGALAAKDALLALAGAALVVLSVARRRRAAEKREEKGRAEESRPGLSPDARARAPLLLRLLFAAGAVGAAAAFVGLTLGAPEGAGDSCRIWNLHARFLFRDPTGVGHALHSLAYWSHPDYPLLLPSLVAEGWRVVGGETAAVPIALAAGFLALETALLVLAVERLRGETSGLAAGLVLLATPMMVLIGGAQIADVPLAGFALATAVLVALELDPATGPPSVARLALAGAAASLGASTKNEGLVFVLAFGAALAAWPPGMPASGRARARRVLAYALGAGPGLLVLAAFKRAWAPPNDLFGHATAGALVARATEPGRAGTIVRLFLDEAFSIHKWSAFPFALPLAVAALGRPARPRSAAGALAGAIGLVLAADVAVYLVTPYGVTWHVTSSIGRLLVQCWPTLVLATLLALPRLDRPARAAP